MWMPLEKEALYCNTYKNKNDSSKLKHHFESETLHSPWVLLLNCKRCTFVHVFTDYPLTLETLPSVKVCLSHGWSLVPAFKEFL